LFFSRYEVQSNTWTEVLQVAPHLLDELVLTFSQGQAGSSW
jgi:hypothetical protein